MPKSILFAALLTCVANPCRSYTQCILISPRSEFFSTVEIVKNVGPAGSELQMDEQADRIVATLREYRGDAAPRETKLQGVLKESGSAGMVTRSVRLSGRDQRGPVSVDGEITLARFRGSITRYIAKKRVTYPISLRRQLYEYENTVATASDSPLMRRAHSALSRHRFLQRENDGHATETA